MPSATERARSGGRVLARVGITAALLLLVLSIVPMDSVATALSSVRPGWVALSWMIALGNVWIAASQLHVLTSALGLRHTIRSIFGHNLTAQLYSLCLPGHLGGGLVRWYRLSRVDGRPARSLAAIGLNRVADTLAVVALGAGCYLADPAQSGPVAITLGLSALLGSALAYRLAFAARTPVLLRTVARRVLPQGKPRRAALALSGALLRGRNLTGRAHATLIARSLLRSTVGLLGVMALAHALDMELSWATLGWVRATTRVVTLIPISIGGLGVRETTVALLLAPYGTSAAESVALSLLIFSQILFRGLAGAVVEAWFWLPGARARRRGEATG